MNYNLNYNSYNDHYHGAGALHSYRYRYMVKQRDLYLKQVHQKEVLDTDIALVPTSYKYINWDYINDIHDADQEELTWYNELYEDYYWDYLVARSTYEETIKKSKEGIDNIDAEYTWPALYHLQMDSEFYYYNIYDLQIVLDYYKQFCIYIDTSVD